MTATRLCLVAIVFIAVCAVSLGADVPQCFAVPEHRFAAPQSWWDEVDLLCRVIMGEATGEPFTGQVAVGAVMLNRVRSPQFPSTLAGVVYEVDAFESVTNGLVWSRTPSESEVRAAELALNGYDPTSGCLFFWNPSKPVSPWIWSRQIVVTIGNHVFAY
jgi:N-acetylmuramoyl-L-alanine amidase